LADYKPRRIGVRRLLAYLALFLGSLLLKITVKGRHHLPKKGPYVLVCNHFSVIDPAVVIYAHRRPISFLAASDHVIEWYNLWAVWLYGFIPTDRVRLAPSTIKAARQALRNGEVLGVFPEGTSTADELREAKPGAAYLSSIETVKILPLSILGLGGCVGPMVAGPAPPGYRSYWETVRTLYPSPGARATGASPGPGGKGNYVSHCRPVARRAPRCFPWGKGDFTLPERE